MEESARHQSVNELKKVLGPALLTVICLGQIIGSGIFVLTGTAAHDYAGPAVVLSYCVSAIMAFVSAMTFVEMAVDYPLAGSSFNYTLAVMGEFPAWVTITAIVVDAILAGGVVARAWSGYLAVLCGRNSSFFIINSHGTQLDFVAFGVTMFITAIVAYGTKESATFNFIFKGTNILLIVLILCLSFPHANKQNWADFWHFGDAGVFGAAAVVVFAYNGYNAACNMAEEARNPKRDLPIAIIGSLTLATTLYVLMAIAITLMVPFYQIDVLAPFSAAFTKIPGWGWCQYLVSVGAVFGIGTVLLIQIMTITREFLVMARHNLIPSWFAYVNGFTGTPLRITLIFGTIKAILALCLPLKELASLVNFGYLFVAFMVASSVLIRRYHQRGITHSGPTIIRWALIVLFSIGFAASYKAWPHAKPLKWVALLVFAIAIIATCTSFYLMKQVYTPAGFKIYGVPYVCGFAIFGAFFLIASLGSEAVSRFFIVLIVISFLYLVYGVHAAESHDNDLDGARIERERQAADMKVGALEMGKGDAGKGAGANGSAAAIEDAKFGAHHDHMPGYHAPHEDVRMVDTPYAHIPNKV
ncbi:hypothetical protein WJX81_005796 [Elliptochloris bilobata]|uniref:Cationic amino acid transporter n=1 Tax=Elliptochloris bilobata TaxID=381761 RepID=A0AAW1QPJ0_9CHLO